MLLDDFMFLLIFIISKIRLFCSYVYAIFSTVATNGVSIGVSIAITNPSRRAMAGTNKLSDKKLKALQGPAVMRQKCMLMVKV
jgi:hypothetical protein